MLNNSKHLGIYNQIMVHRVTEHPDRLALNRVIILNKVHLTQYLVHRTVHATDAVSSVTGLGIALRETQLRVHREIGKGRVQIGNSLMDRGL